MTEPTVLILAGAGDPSSVWSVVCDAVRDGGVRCEVIEYPMKGVDTGPQPTSVEDYASWILGVINGRDLTDVVLAGHSMGALVAIEAASSLSRRLTGVIVMCPAEPMFVHPLLLEKAENEPAEAAGMIARWSYSPDARDSMEHLIAGHVAATSALDPGVLASDLHACNNYENASSAAANIVIPVTIVLSGEDHMTPVSAATPVLEALAGSTVHVLDGAGHAIEHERPDEVAAIIVSVATRSDATTPSQTLT
jgi:aromatic-L-amino-acid decarboxylase